MALSYFLVNLGGLKKATQIQFRTIASRESRVASILGAKVINTMQSLATSPKNGIKRS